MSDRIPAQIRWARGMLDWSMAQLAEASALSVSTVKRMEMGHINRARTTPVKPSEQPSRLPG